MSTETTTGNAVALPGRIIIMNHNRAIALPGKDINHNRAIALPGKDINHNRAIALPGKDVNHNRAVAAVAARS